MKSHLTDDELQDYLDGRLTPSADYQARQHLSSCHSCHRKLEGLKDLLVRAAGLSHEVTPPPEIWSRIERAVERPIPEPAVRSFTPGSRPLRWALAAGLAGLVTAVWLAGTGPGREGPSHELSETAASEIRDYQGLVAQLERELEARRQELPPEVMAMVEDNLAIIDQAVAEIAQALDMDPENEVLLAVLASSYRQKLAVLEHLMETTS